MCGVIDCHVQLTYLMAAYMEVLNVFWGRRIGRIDGALVSGMLKVDRLQR